MSGHEADMNTFGAFEQNLQDALSHLYDPTYRPAMLLRQVLGFESQQGVKDLRAAILRAIEELKPEATVPDTARIQRVYGLLFYKFVQNLSQEEAAERLGITSRHLRREQPEAIHALALFLWEKGNAAGQLERVQPNPLHLAWRSQVKEELASLQESASSTVASVNEVIETVVALERALLEKHGMRLDTRVQPGLVVMIHPSALRQVLISALSQLIAHISPDAVPGVGLIEAQRAGQRVLLRVTGEPVSELGNEAQPFDTSFIAEILEAHDGAISVHVVEQRAAFVIELQPAEQTVLVVDDNMDLAHLYRRYTLGTRYNIVHIAQGQRVLDAVEAYKPAAIVLDVMLPDIDGWLLLSQLREHPVMRDVPVVVCSVVKEEELARALGARFYLQKPVQRQQFIQVLGQALGQAATA